MHVFELNHQLKMLICFAFRAKEILIVALCLYFSNHILYKYEVRKADYRLEKHIIGLKN